jgi:hypothetical protein
VPWNIVQESETFNTGWSFNLATVTSNSQTAPNGTLTADTLNSTTTQYSGIYQGIGTLPTNAYTYSMYAKAGTNNFFYMLAEGQGNQYGFFNLSTGVVGITQGITSSSITSVGNGWYRCEVVKNNTSGIEMFFGSSNIENTTATASGTVFIWGAQTNIGSTAKPYFPTTDRLNVPRLTYQNGGGGCPSLLLEKQSTNLALYSEQFDNAAWAIAGGITITANDTTSPDGTQNADLLSHGSFSTYLYQNLGTLSGTITTSIFVKKGSQSSIAFGFVSGGFTGGMSVKFNLDTQTFSTPTNYANFTSISATYQSLGNGWYRLNLTGTTATSDTYYYVIGSLLESFAVNAYLWGAQLEASSYPTSYIPTTSSSATRVADLSTSDTIQTAQTFAGDFTIFADFVPFIDSTDGNGLMILGGGASGLGATYQSYLWFIGSNVYLRGDGEVNIIQRSYSMVVNQRVKIAFTRVGTTVKMFVNGAQVGASATSSLSITIRSIGWSYNLPTYQTKGKINQILLSASGASDTDAISLTTI